MLARCPFCTAEVSPSQRFCPSCGLPLPGAAPGFAPPPAVSASAPAAPAPLMPASAALPAGAWAPQPAGVEKPHFWIWLGNLVSIGAGVAVIVIKWQGSVGIGVAIGLFALAALSLGVSRFGTRWKRASCLEKLFILPGTLAGLAVLAAIALSGLDSDSGHSSGSSGSSHSGSGSAKGGDGGDLDLDFEGDDASRARRGRRANPLLTLTCPHCGQMSPPGTRFCLRCGQPL